MTRLHQPHAIEVGLHVRKINVVFLTPEMMGTGFSNQGGAMDVARSGPQEAHYHADVYYLLP